MSLYHLLCSCNSCRTELWPLSGVCSTPAPPSPPRGLSTITLGWTVSGRHSPAERSRSSLPGAAAGPGGAPGSMGGGGRPPRPLLAKVSINALYTSWNLHHALHAFPQAVTLLAKVSVRAFYTSVHSHHACMHCHTSSLCKPRATDDRSNNDMPLSRQPHMYCLPQVTAVSQSCSPICWPEHIVWQQLYLCSMPCSHTCILWGTAPCAFLPASAATCSNDPSSCPCTHDVFGCISCGPTCTVSPWPVDRSQIFELISPYAACPPCRDGSVFPMKRSSQNAASRSGWSEAHGCANLKSGKAQMGLTGNVLGRPVPPFCNKGSEIKMNGSLRAACRHSMQRIFPYQLNAPVK